MLRPHGIFDYKIEMGGAPTPSYPTDGLIARWTFDSTLGNSYGRPITLGIKTGTVDFSTGKIGNCAVFDGTDGVYTNDTSILSIFQARNTWTVAFWGVMDASRTGSGQHYFWSCSKNADQYPFTRSQVSSIAGGLDINTARFQSSPAINQNTTPVSKPGPVNWFHFASTFDGTRVKDYLNGSLVGTSGDDTDNMGTSNNEFGIGYRPQSSNNLFKLIGKIDTMYVYNKALSQSEIEQLYNGGSGI